MLTWPDTIDDLHRMYADFISSHGKQRAAYEISAAYGLSYKTVLYRLTKAGVHVGVKRTPRAPGNGICACGDPATAGRYKGLGEPLCFRCYMRTYAADKGSKFRRKARTYIAEVKRDVPCADCGGNFPPCCMHFDHVPERGPKLFNLGSGDYSIEAVQAEIEKCDIVCANCHAIRTWISRGKPADEAA